MITRQIASKPSCRRPIIHFGPVGLSQLLMSRRQRKPAAAAAPAGPEPGEPKPVEAPAVDAAKPEEAKPEEPKPEEPKPEEPKPEEAKTEEAKNEEPRAWTALEDAALLQLKAQKKSWKDIGEVITGREEHELRNRYKELKPGRDEDKGKKETGGEDGKGTGAGTNGQGGKGKKQGQKGQSNDSGDKNGGKGKEQGATEAGSGYVLSSVCSLYPWWILDSPSLV